MLYNSVETSVIEHLVGHESSGLGRARDHLKGGVIDHIVIVITVLDIVITTLNIVIVLIVLDILDIRIPAISEWASVRGRAH